MLKRNPRNYSALEKAIRLLYRAGTLTKALPFIEAARKESVQSTGAVDAGVQFCAGLYERFVIDFI